MRLIYLEWEDSRSADGWHDKDEVEEYFAKSTLVKQVGWVYSEDKRNLCLVCRLGEYQWNGSDEPAYGHIQKIPKTWIRTRIDLTEAIKDA